MISFNFTKIKKRKEKRAGELWEKVKCSIYPVFLFVVVAVVAGPSQND